MIVNVVQRLVNCVKTEHLSNSVVFTHLWQSRHMNILDNDPTSSAMCTARPNRRAALCTIKPGKILRDVGSIRIP
eukprot:4023125-Prorocentrum_lima.AAC.1